ncbi:GSCOCG00003196001-RA-CDS [Cotesia congregata]|nr:GSCOCG00003196001-RA-CDS [Cotesia congregata]
MYGLQKPKEKLVDFETLRGFCSFASLPVVLSNSKSFAIAKCHAFIVRKRTLETFFLFRFLLFFFIFSPHHVIMRHKETHVVRDFSLVSPLSNEQVSFLWYGFYNLNIKDKQYVR